MTPMLQVAGNVALDTVLFIAFPYTVVVLFLSMTIKRYVSEKFTYSTFSSQFLENRQQFIGSVPWHYGILALFLGHLVAFLFPANVLLWNSVPARLYFTELAAFAFAIVTLFGLVNLIVRRARHPRVRAVTSKMDVLILALLLFQVLSGMYIAYYARWGSSWFAAVLSPYLWSLFTFTPDISGVSQLPLSIKIHLVGAFTIFAVFPFTRLVHVLVVPNHYLWRRPQVVIWNAARRMWR
ncbi:MAG: respiratory nitrate reductase subunit gamma [Planctomycetaceae bacterium]|nr:respiratory nitrate reductase subunit gamma [Planctomycetaceae bacterium]